ncbi:uncharacterized protein L3040_002876 [Drepanopeziza brunnea f. sp. 'multigermtubi']|uniref:uncharacterized protein n=1 Tax=Drepanopeziza brunnea f. sp. 'multigermtubi' TaxID=698441 RepID=UPI002398EE2E|nr:hypothetical protein L3040_002876 [Drepanopeziza brunnea f. sp. 'multigermtubi']
MLGTNKSRDILLDQFGPSVGAWSGGEGNGSQARPKNEAIRIQSCCDCLIPPSATATQPHRRLDSSGEYLAGIRFIDV